MKILEEGVAIGVEPEGLVVSLTIKIQCHAEPEALRVERALGICLGEWLEVSRDVAGRSTAAPDGAGRHAVPHGAGRVGGVGSVPSRLFDIIYLIGHYSGQPKGG